MEKRILDEILIDYQAELPIRKRFLHVGTALLRYFICHPLDFRYLEQFHNSPYGVVHRRDKLLGQEQGGELYLDLFRQGVAQGEIKTFPLPILFSLAFGPLLAVARDHILGFIQLNDSLIDRTIGACLDAVRS